MKDDFDKKKKKRPSFIKRNYRQPSCSESERNYRQPSCSESALILPRRYFYEFILVERDSVIP